MERRDNSTRRSTRLSLEFLIVLTSLDPAYGFCKECKTVVVNAHGCCVIVPERLKSETPVMVKLISNGAGKNGRVVLGIPLLRTFVDGLGSGV